MKTEDLEFYEECGYQEIHEVSGSVICLQRFVFTWAILAELNRIGYERRWCYPTRQEALDAMNVWIKSDDEEPDHWIRRTHIHDEYPPNFSSDKGHRMSDVVNGRLNINELK